MNDKQMTTCEDCGHVFECDDAHIADHPFVSGMVCYGCPSCGEVLDMSMRAPEPHDESFNQSRGITLHYGWEDLQDADTAIKAGAIVSAIIALDRALRQVVKHGNISRLNAIARADGEELPDAEATANVCDLVRTLLRECMDENGVLNTVFGP